MSAHIAKEPSLLALAFPGGAMGEAVALGLWAPWYIHAIPTAALVVGLLAMRRWW